MDKHRSSKNLLISKIIPKKIKKKIPDSNYEEVFMNDDTNDMLDEKINKNFEKDEKINNYAVALTSQIHHAFVN